MNLITIQNFQVRLVDFAVDAGGYLVYMQAIGNQTSLRAIWANIIQEASTRKDFKSIAFEAGGEWSPEREAFYLRDAGDYRRFLAPKSATSY